LSKNEPSILIKLFLLYDTTDMIICWCGSFLDWNDWAGHAQGRN